MKLLITTIALAATLASPAFAQTRERAATHAYGQAIHTPVRHSAQGGGVYLPGDTINADAASRALIHQDELKDCYLKDWCN
jgi:hypothetical protein